MNTQNKEIMQRQGLNVSISELINLVDSLKSEAEELNEKLGLGEIDFNKKWLINIINKERGLSDTWELE